MCALGRDRETVGPRRTHSETGACAALPRARFRPSAAAARCSKFGPREVCIRGARPTGPMRVWMSGSGPDDWCISNSHERERERFFVERSFRDRSLNE